jgi:hypothetical protein
MKMTRLAPGDYRSADGRYRIWREEVIGDIGVGRWYVSDTTESDPTDTVIIDAAGFATRWEAVQALERQLAT